MYNYGTKDNIILKRNDPVLDIQVTFRFKKVQTGKRFIFYHIYKQIGSHPEFLVAARSFPKTTPRWKMYNKACLRYRENPIPSKTL